MNTITTRTVVALSTLMWLDAAGTASELPFSDIEQRLTAIEHQLAEQQGVRTASYLSDTGAYDGMPASAPNAYCDGWDCGNQPCGFYYAEVQLLWLRAHVMEDFAGKLSERHYFSPRLVLGYEDPGGVGARIRYWHWGNTVPILAGGGVRLEWDVIDVEATGRLQWGRTDVVFTGGFRYADVDIADESADFYGLTFAIDTRRMFYCRGNSAVYGVGSARFSILGGDWDGDPSDDNMVVHELYGGIEYRCSYCGYDLYARAVAEIQNWHSDALATNTGTDTIGFVGPAFHFGATF